MKYVVPVSGGKDSQAILSWAVKAHKNALDDLIVVHQNTNFDHPDTYAHLEYMERRYGVTIQHIKSAQYKGVIDFIRTSGYFPNSLARGCTSRLKQKPFGEWLIQEGLTVPGAAHVYMGMRTAESNDRASKYGALELEDTFYLNELSTQYGIDFRHVQCSLPIVNWSTEQVFEYLEANGDRVNPLYAKGATRVGCFPCLLSGGAEWKLAAADKTGRKHIRELLKIEKEFKEQNNPRKLVLIHETRDIEYLLKTGNLKYLKKGERRALIYSEDADIGTACKWCAD